MKLRKFRLADVKSNPFRDLDLYPLIPEQVQLLKGSIEATRLWPMSVRISKAGEPEIPYGHHRLQAAIDLWGLDYEQTFVVEQIDDDEMLRRMADENAVSHAGGAGVQHAIMCVRAARDHLLNLGDGLFKQATGHDRPANGCIGQGIIAAYFGKGPLAKSGTVGKVLPILKAVSEHGIPENQILRLPNLHQAETFVREFIAGGYAPSMTKDVVDDLEEHLTLVGGGTTPGGKSASRISPENRLTAKNIAGRLRAGGVFEPGKRKPAANVESLLGKHLERLTEALDNAISECSSLAHYLETDPGLVLGGFDNSLWKDLDSQRERLLSLMSGKTRNSAASIGRKMIS